MHITHRLFLVNKEYLFLRFRVFEEDRCPTNIVLTYKCKHYAKATNSRYAVYNVNSFRQLSKRC